MKKDRTRLRGWLRMLLALVCLAVLAACAPAGAKDKPPLSVRDAWARPAAAGGTGAIFFVIDNPGDQADALLSVSTSTAQAAELHKTSMDDAGVMKMAQQEKVEVPANSQVEFKPGGLHVMLINLERDLKEGDSLTARLTFQNAGEVTITAEVKMQ